MCVVLLLGAVVACGDPGGGATPDAGRRDAAVTDATPTARLTLDRRGTGTITSAPAGLDCGVFCSHDFPLGTEVHLTVTPPPSGVTFAGWSGPCAGTGDCVVTVDRDLTVIATFTGAPCVDECTASQTECVTSTSDHTCGQFDADTCLDWSPATTCTGVDECRLGRCGGAHLLSVVPLPEGMTLQDVGTVTANPAGITCGRASNDCQEFYPAGTSVTLTATSDATAVFYGWALLPLGGTNGMQCVGSTAPCTVSMTTQTSLAAAYCSPECTAGTSTCANLTTVDTCGQFDDDPCLDRSGPTACPANQLCTATGCHAGFVVNANVGGPGVGQVAIDGVTCTQFPCSRGVATGGSATLTAIPEPYTVFTGWSGACTGMGPCVVSVPGTATANFADRCVDNLDFVHGTVHDVVLAGTTLYYNRYYDFSTAIWKTPRAGGASTQIAPAGLGYLLVDEPYVYWGGTNGGTYTVLRSSGGATETLVTDASSDIATLNATHLFYPKGATLQRVPKAGGTALQLAAGLPLAPFEAPSLLADATSAYWFGNGTVVKVPVGGGAPVTLATTNQVRFDVVTQDATYLYWNRGADIVRVAKAGGAVETLVVGAEPGGIAVLGTTMVWTGGAGPSSHAYVTTLGSGVVTQLSYLETEASPRSITLDATRIYVAGYHGGGDFLIRFTRSPTCAP